MPDWRDLTDLAAGLAGGARRAARAVERALGKTGAYRVVGYRGYGTPDRLLVLGRVIEHTRIADADPSLPRWRNLLATLQRIDAEPLPHATVRAQVATVAHGASAAIPLGADDEGFLRHWITPPKAVSSRGWHDVDLELVSAPDTDDQRALDVRSRPASVLVPSTAAQYGVVSDMDDTVLQSQITSFLRAAQLMLLENARTRLPFPGVAAFYRALERGTLPREQRDNPIFYVSSSPWNLYDVIAGFLEAQEIPAGPMLLRDWDIGPSLLRNRDYKLAQIREILRTYPALPFMLVGDSGQEDPEIYSALVSEFPHRILAIYIRNVSAHPERSDAIRALAEQVSAAGSSLVLADDTLTVARHAAAHGWIREEALAEIGTEKRADEGTTGAKVDAPGVTKEQAPTVVVDETVRRKDLE
jgi:phosphatidate phosphatase APP1